MRNPKEFKATPFSHFAPVDHSHTGTHELSHNGTRKEVMTSPMHFKPTPHSSTGRGMLAHNATRSEMAPAKMPMVTPHSKPGAPVEPKKWHKKGYTLSGPLDQNFGKA